MSVYSESERDADEFFQEDRVTDRMVAVGALCLREYVDELGPNGLMSVARHVFCAMRAEEARQRLPKSKRDE